MMERLSLRGQDVDQTPQPRIIFTAMKDGFPSQNDKRIPQSNSLKFKYSKFIKDSKLPSQNGERIPQPNNWRYISPGPEDPSQICQPNKSTPLEFSLLFDSLGG